MEVHHSHHPTHKKKWSEYLLEFFMLFFAVTLGFFAENKREEQVETHREKQYMQSLYEDLKKDTAVLNAVKNFDNNQVNRIDTAIQVLNNNEWNVSSIKMLYSLNLKNLGNVRLNLNERTSSQLKNAGGMRLIEKQSVSNKISEYWELTERIKSNGEVLEELRIKAREKSYSIFANKYYLNYKDGNVKEDTKLMTTDLYILTEYANRINHIKNSISNVRVPLIIKLNEKAKALLLILKKEYKLNDDANEEVLTN